MNKAKWNNVIWSVAERMLREYKIDPNRLTAAQRRRLIEHVESVLDLAAHEVAPAPANFSNQ